VEPGQLLFALLSQAPDVVALLSYAPKPGQTELRVYPLRAPQGTPLPYVCYQVVSQNPDTSADCDLDDTARVQLSIFAKTYAQVCTLSQACRQVLHRQRVGSIAIDLDQQIDQYSDPAVCYYRTQDYLLDGLSADSSAALDARFSEDGAVRVLETS
jgi:hypothetical protein